MDAAREERIKELKARIEKLKKNLPAHRHKTCATHIVHSDPPELWIQIEELEEELAQLEKSGQ